MAYPVSSPSLTFSDPMARRQYRLLMNLYRWAFNRSLFGVFARQLGRWFPDTTRVFLTLPSGGVFPIALNDAYWTRFALFHTEYEPEIAKILDATCTSATTFCDLGANKGYWTIYAAPLFQKVISIEASSATFRELATNTRDLSNVDRRWAAAYRQSNLELQFQNVSNSHASGHLAQDSTKDPKRETVETVAVDDLLAPGLPAIIKMDVEGAERDAIQGARRAIAEGSIVIFEDHGADSSCDASAAFFELGSISVYFIDDTLVPMHAVDTVRAIKSDRFRGYNFLAAHEDAPLLDIVKAAFANA